MYPGRRENNRQYPPRKRWDAGTEDSVTLIRRSLRQSQMMATSDEVGRPESLRIPPDCLRRHVTIEKSKPHQPLNADGASPLPKNTLPKNSGPNNAVQGRFPGCRVGIVQVRTTRGGSCAPEGARGLAPWCQPRVSVAAVFPAVAAVVTAVFPPVAATVDPVGDDNGPADGGCGPASASCCQWHVRLLLSLLQGTGLRHRLGRRR